MVVSPPQRPRSHAFILHVWVFGCVQATSVFVLMVESLTGVVSLGVSSVFSIVESFGCVAAVATTTFRKALTMLISFLVFPKPFTMM